MTDTPLSPREEDDALAAEYVLGVLALPDRSAAEARIKRDAGFAALVEAWELRMEGMNDGFDPAPVGNLLPAIEARLFPQPARARKRRFGLSLGWLSGAVAAAALALATVAVLVPPRQADVATLASADNRLAYAVTRFGDSLRITRIAGEAAAPGRVHELWVVPPGAPPQSLGLLQDQPLVVDVPALAPGYVLAVSVEAEGGSTTGAPQGPIILTAKLDDRV